MKKVFILTAVIFLVVSSSVFSQTEKYYEQGRFVFGGSGSMSIYTEAGDSSGVSIFLYPEFGYFPVNNLELLMGMNTRFSSGSMLLQLDSGIKYFLSGSKFVPYAGANVSYTVADDFYGEEGLINLQAVTGLDFFMIQRLAFYVELTPLTYYMYDGYSDFGSYIYMRFGFHFYVPVGPLEFTGS